MKRKTLTLIFKVKDRFPLTNCIDNHPSGNFIDLVKRNYYDGLYIHRVAPEVSMSSGCFGRVFKVSETHFSVLQINSTVFSSDVPSQRTLMYTTEHSMKMPVKEQVHPTQHLILALERNTLEMNTVILKTNLLKGFQTTKELYRYVDFFC
jgi:hypothetical protein